MCVFDDLGLAHRYEVEIDPEFPGDGQWGCPSVGFTSNGDRTDFLANAAGLIVRFQTEQDGPWIASFSGTGGSRLRGLYALPCPDEILVVLDGAALIVNAADPERQATRVGWSVHQVVAVEEPSLVLVAGFFDITALGVQGLRWSTPRLCLDDLRIDATALGKVMCSGQFMSRDNLVLDLTTGEQLSGPTFR